MPFPGKPSITKRQKELTRQQRAKEKAARRANKPSDRPEAAGDEDPDIAGIVPGPQPVATNGDGEAEE